MPRRPQPRLALCAREDMRTLTSTQPDSTHPVSRRPAGIHIAFPAARCLAGPRNVPPRGFVWEEALGHFPDLAWTSTATPHSPSAVSVPGAT